MTRCGRPACYRAALVPFAAFAPPAARVLTMFRAGGNQWLRSPMRNMRMPGVIVYD
jgi:hypothetical protein